ncbi:hypothetical protein HYW20_02300 [Candidatus Woesearchaeota archaeon]|nr:hypothetical protein [Candidatus Woesearchaeota archaeon]
MRFCLFVAVFILLSLNAGASWRTFQNDSRNTGAADGIGHFPLQTANFSDNSLGMDFQPLVDDLNADGGNEIAVFSNNSLIIFNPQLNILTQTKVGQILGQPTLFDFDNDDFIEIIFNSRQNSTDYFFAYQYNNLDLQQESNITLGNASFGGIKCININGTGFCVFKDKGNYVHIVNMDSETDSSYSTSAYNETRQTVPAIGDIDNDGAYEAVFWLNNDSGGGYGFLVFDLDQRKVDWIVDNIFSPFITNFALKGQPVLVDLNNDRKLEIAASVFYDDALNIDFATDWYTELFVYSFNGTKLFSKCETGVLGCNDGFATGGADKRWEGTNPFVLDYNNGGRDEICFIKDEKIGLYFDHMGFNCYNYSGNEIARVNLTLSDTVKGIATTADMNNDGSREIITYTDIYLLNGTSIMSFDFGTNAPVPADIDGNEGMDLLWTEGNKIKVFLDSNNYTIDLSVDSSDISFQKFNSTHVVVNAIIKNTGEIEAKNADAFVYNEDTSEENTAVLSIGGRGNATFSSILALKEGEKVWVSIDPYNGIDESDEKNNVAFREFGGLPYVFVSVSLEPSNINSEFQEYIKNKLTSGYYTSNANEADVKVYIGKNNPRNQDNNIKTLNDFEFGYDYGNIFYNDGTGTLPYNGLIGGFKDSDGKVKIMIVGNEIEGDISAAKEFIKNQALLLNAQDSIFVDDENIDAVRVFDFLHLGGNNEHYKVGNDEFRRIVRNALNDEMFNVEDKTVVTGNDITLRLRNLKPNISSDYLEYLNSTGVPTDLPVVLARGIHSNLTTWETLAGELANEGRDAWLIEITGGPNTECDECPNYNFSDLTDNYWSTLVNGILSFTGRDKIQYVGHSNGGRVAIESLANGVVNPNKIDTLIGVAVPSAFEGYSTFGFYFGKYGEQIMEELEGKSHVSMTEIGDKLREICLSKSEISCTILTRGLKSDNKMSFNVDKQLYLLIINDSDEHIGKDLELDNFYILEGWITDDKENNITHDFIVTEQDEKGIYKNIISSNKKHYKIWGAHTAGWSSASLPDRTITKSIIKDALNKKTLTKYKSNEINST